MKIWRNINIFTKLRLIRCLTLCIWMIAAAFVAWGNHYIAAIVVSFIAIGLENKCHICPHCYSHLDVRMSLYEGIHCPSCGTLINAEE